MQLETTEYLFLAAVLSVLAWWIYSWFYDQEEAFNLNSMKGMFGAAVVLLACFMILMYGS